MVLVNRPDEIIAGVLTPDRGHTSAFEEPR